MKLDKGIKRWAMEEYRVYARSKADVKALLGQKRIPCTDSLIRELPIENERFFMQDGRTVFG